MATHSPNLSPLDAPLGDDRCVTISEENLHSLQKLLVRIVDLMVDFETALRDGEGTTSSGLRSPTARNQVEGVSLVHVLPSRVVQSKQPAAERSALADIVARHIGSIKLLPLGTIFAALRLDFPIDALFAPDSSSSSAQAMGASVSLSGAMHHHEDYSESLDDPKRKSTTVISKVVKGVATDGLKTINCYTVLDELGRGSFGKVKLACVGDTNEMRAIKIVPKKLLRDKYSAPITDGKEGAHTTRFWGEVEIMKKLKHRNIVRLYEVIDDPQSQKLYLVMQYIERGPIVKLDPTTGTCTPLDVEIASGYMKQIVNAVAYMHSQRICHRDIKPDAILLGANGRAYLSDFGVSSMLADGAEDVSDGETAGSPQFWAPEMFVSELSINSLPNPYAADVWALGITFYTIIYGRLPFAGCRTLNDLADAVKTAPIEFGPIVDPLMSPCASPLVSPRELQLTPVFGSTHQLLSRDSLLCGDLVRSASDSDLSRALLCNNIVDLLQQMLDRDPAKRISIHRVRRHPLFHNPGEAVRAPPRAAVVSPTLHLETPLQGAMAFAARDRKKNNSEQSLSTDSPLVSAGAVDCSFSESGSSSSGKDV